MLPIDISGSMPHPPLTKELRDKLNIKYMSVIARLRMLAQDIALFQLNLDMYPDMLELDKANHRVKMTQMEAEKADLLREFHILYIALDMKTYDDAINERRRAYGFLPPL